MSKFQKKIEKRKKRNQKIDKNDPQKSRRENLFPKFLSSYPLFPIMYLNTQSPEVRLINKIDSNEKKKKKEAQVTL